MKNLEPVAFDTLRHHGAQILHYNPLAGVWYFHDKEMMLEQERSRFMQRLPDYISRFLTDLAWV